MKKKTKQKSPVKKAKPSAKKKSLRKASIKHLKQSSVKILRDARHVVEEAGDALSEAATLTSDMIGKQIGGVRSTSR